MPKPAPCYDCGKPGILARGFGSPPVCPKCLAVRTREAHGQRGGEACPGCGLPSALGCDQLPGCPGVERAQTMLPPVPYYASDMLDQLAHRLIDEAHARAIKPLSTTKSSVPPANAPADIRETVRPGKRRAG